MKILVLADDESKVLYEHFDPEKIRDVDLILACGDLRRNYLDFFASVSRAPVLYVLGNHDHWNKEERIGGCICIEDEIYVYKGVRILDALPPGRCESVHGTADGEENSPSMAETSQTQGI